MERPSEDAAYEETTSLLDRHEQENGKVTGGYVGVTEAVKVIPFALLASLAIAVTSATMVFAYASLICRDPAHCQDAESSDYAASVAVAVFLANVAGTFALGPLGQLVTKYRAAAMWVWIICRALSVAVLALGVYLGSIKIAICARLFEGLASDNLLHFNLNAVYAQIPDKSLVSRFMGTSFALYMAGMSVGPVIGGLFSDFTTSFAVALALLLVMAVYLAAIPFFTQGDQAKEEAEYQSIEPEGYSSWREQITQTIRLVFSPLRLLYQLPRTAFYCISILFYTMVQSYLFSAIMVYTSLRFEFTSRENSFLVSIAAFTSAVYLVTIHHIIPEVVRLLRRRRSADFPEGKSQHGSHDLVLGAASIAVQLVTLTAFSSITRGWHAYVLIAVSSIGLTASSFIKSHFARTVPNPAQSMATLTMMETIGAMLSPVVLGAWLAAHPGGSFFYITSGMLGAAIILFVTGGCVAG
ncbi:major facilitator superfamily domain-containing protein [Phaeosphaeriaceae sp. PMI808]|nr:major facilitator superfamily domain-containing protein [Phaeosphaeriaceae sp. PMI808]